MVNRIPRVMVNRNPIRVVNRIPISGEEMIRKEMYEKVQLFKRQGYSISEITSELEIDPKTTAKYYAMDAKGVQDLPERAHVSG